MNRYNVQSGQLNRTLYAWSPREAAIQALELAPPGMKFGVLTLVEVFEDLSELYFSTEKLLAEIGAA